MALLPSLPALDWADWIMLAKADLARRWARGQRLTVEHYLDLYPSVRDHPDAVLELLAAELMARIDACQPAGVDELIGRFPSLAGRVAKLVAACRVADPDRLPVPPTVAATPAVGLSRDPVADDPLPTDLPGYELLGELGRGAMGVVYKARQTFLNRIVALKTLHGGGDPAGRVRFLAEAEAIAKLRHPNVVGVFDLGTAAGRPFVVLEYMPGGSLERRLTAGPLPAADAVRLLVGLCRGVQSAHDAGVVHRDLKPSNVLLDADGTPKVADFGLVMSTTGSAGVTATGAVLGTPSYMAPEQAADSHKVDHRADVYALGATLYHLLTARPPFRAANALETMHLVMTTDPVPPRALQPGLSRDLETVVLKCLHKDPDRRYQSAADLAADLERVLAGEPIVARRPSPVERLRAAARHHPRLSVALATAAAVGLAVVGGGLAVGVVARERELGRRLAEGETALARAAAAAPPAADRAFEDALKAFAAARAWDDGPRPRAGLRAVYQARIDALLKRDQVDAARALLLPLTELSRTPADMEAVRDAARKVAGPARLAVATDPPGAEVALVRLGDDLQPLPAEPLGRTPLPARDLDPGHYRLAVTAAGRPPVTHPLRADRNADLAVSLHLPAAVPAGMVYVPPGEFTAGEPGEERRVTLAGFFIDRAEVTGAEYEKFVAATGRPPPDKWEGSARCPAHLRAAPVFNVSWYDAAAYAAWAGKRLPTGDEWEKAARGTDARPYPWGRRFDPWRCVHRTLYSFEKSGRLTEGASPYGVLDLAGGVWEWTRDRYAPGEPERVIRGGCGASEPDQLLTFRRHRAQPAGSDGGALNLLGFRCVVASGPDPFPGPDGVGALDRGPALGAAAKAGRWGDVPGHVAALLAANPRSALGNFWRAVLLHRDGKSAEAWPHVVRAAVVNPSLEVPYRGGLKAAVADIGQAAGAVADPAGLAVPTLRDQASAALDANRPAEAESLARRALALDPADGETHERLAEALRALKRAAEADAARAVRAADYAARLAEDPDLPKLHFEAARFLMADPATAGRALELLDRATALDPDQAEYHHWRAELLLRAGRRAEALTAAQRAVDLAPADDRYRALRDRCRGG